MTIYHALVIITTTGITWKIRVNCWHTSKTFAICCHVTRNDQRKNALFDHSNIAHNSVTPKKLQQIATHLSAVKLEARFTRLSTMRLIYDNRKQKVFTEEDCKFVANVHILLATTIYSYVRWDSTDSRITNQWRFWWISFEGLTIQKRQRAYERTTLSQVYRSEAFIRTRASAKFSFVCDRRWSQSAATFDGAIVLLASCR